MGSLKSGRKFDRQSLEANIDSPKKTSMTFSLLPSTKLKLEEYSKLTHDSTSEFINDILEKVILVYENGGSIEDIQGAVNNKKTEAALTKVQKEKDQLTKEKQTVDIELNAQKVQVAKLNTTVTSLTQQVNDLREELTNKENELLDTKEKNLLIELPKRAKDLYLEQVAFRIKEGKNKSATGVFIELWLTALENSFTRSDKLKRQSVDRNYIEGLVKEYL